MKLTKEKLQQIIKEELNGINEEDYWTRGVTEDPKDMAAKFGIDLAARLFDWWEKYDSAIPQDFPRNELKKLVDTAQQLKKMGEEQ